MKTQDPPSEAPRRTAVRPWFWGGLIGVLMMAAVLSLFSSIRGARQWADAWLQSEADPDTPLSTVVRVTLGGEEAYDLDETDAARVRMDLSRLLQDEEGGALTTMRSDIDQRLDPVFAAAHARVPVFVDWYYSLSGEYTRLFKALVGELPEFMADRMQELVFDAAGTEAAIETLEETLDARTVERMRRSLTSLETTFIRLVRRHGQAIDAGRVQVTEQWAFPQGMAGSLEPFLALTPSDVARQGVASSAGAAAAAIAIKKLGAATVAKLGAGKSLAGMGAMGAKAGAKALVKEGGTLASAGAGAATGAALCAGTVVGMPLSPACALLGGAVVGAITWVAVDKAVLEVDEYLSRESFDQEIHAALDAQKEELRTMLERRHAETLQAGYRQMRAQLDRRIGIAPARDFVPADAARAPGNSTPPAE